MSIREIINGSLEPLWRKHARDDADTFKHELLRATPSRRAFLAEGGSALMLEYLATRRAVAFPLLHRGPGGSAPPPATGSIYNYRLGSDTTYQYLPDALFAMQTGDTIILPAGTTYQYQGETYYYQDWHTTDWGRYMGGSGWNHMVLGTNGFFGGMLTADHGALQGSGTANNGRALIAPPYGFLAADFHTTDTEMYLDPSTPVTNFKTGPEGGGTIWPNNAINFGEFAHSVLNFTGVDKVANAFTGVSGNITGTIPAGSSISGWLTNAKGIIIIAGTTGPWTLTNIETAYGTSDSSSGEISPLLQASPLPSEPRGGSVICNNGFFHNCRQAVGLGYAGGPGNGIFAQFFDTEFTQNGANDGQTHNLYIGHIDELLMDNCYTHNTAGTWLLKSRAALSLITNCQIRGERTDSNQHWGWNWIDNSGCDFSNGGLVYIIGCIFQESLNPANKLVNFNAEMDSWNNPAGGSWELGAPNPIQEYYLINNTFIGSTAGTVDAPVRLYQVGVVHRPQFTKLTQSSATSPSGPVTNRRSYFASLTCIGIGGGESDGSPMRHNSGSDAVWETLAISANNVMTVPSPLQVTGASGWNCYMNYADPKLYFTNPPDNPVNGNMFFWDAAMTANPVFSYTSGGNTISVTGTLVNGDSVIHAVSGLSGGLASITQLVGLTVYVGSVSTRNIVVSVDTNANTITMNGGFTGTGTTETITFGYYLFCGFTYATALGDSVNTAFTPGLNPGFWANVPSANYYDGSYTSDSNGNFVPAAIIQVDPGNKLVVHAPPTGPAWSSGINFWATPIPYWSGYGVPNPIAGDYGYLGLTKQNASPIAFGGTFTTPASVVAPKAQRMTPNFFKQNASLIAFGTNFTEADSGLVNLNSTTGKLQWYRRGAGNVGDCWYAVVPTGGLSNYSETMYLNNNGSTFVIGSVGIWRGCAANLFDANFPFPAMNPSKDSAVINTASGNVTVIAGFRSVTGATGTAGTGFATIMSAFPTSVIYASSVTAFTHLTVTNVGGNSGDSIMVDALIGTSAPPTLVKSVNINATGGGIINFTIPAANAGDVLYLITTNDGLANVVGIGNLMGPPPNYGGNAVGRSPICLIQNCLSANFNPTLGGTGGWTCMGDYSRPLPEGYTGCTITTSLQTNPSNGTTFAAPLWATVFANADPTQLDFRLAVGSPALAAASNPGTNSHGQDLIPHYQSSWHGVFTPGTPLPAKTARTDIGSGKTGSIGALSG